MGKDIGGITQDLLGAAKAKGFDTAQISGIMDSPEGRALLAQLNAPGGEAIKEAASKAAGGDAGALSALLGSLMATKEGKSIANQVMAMKRNG